MNSMFKDWDFWKPILKFASIALTYFLLLYFLPQIWAAVIAGSAVVIFFLYMLFMMGKTSYDYKQFQIKNNYKKLTGKEMDEE